MSLYRIVTTGASFSVRGSGFSISPEGHLIVLDGEVVIAAFAAPHWIGIETQGRSEKGITGAAE